MTGEEAQIWLDHQKLVQCSHDIVSVTMFAYKNGGFSHNNLEVIKEATDRIKEISTRYSKP